MNKPRYLEYLLHMLRDEELRRLCEARVIEPGTSREEQIRRILREPTGKIYDKEYLSVLPEETLQSLCIQVGYPKVAEREGEELLTYATYVFRDVDWSKFVNLPGRDLVQTTGASTDTLAAWKELEDLGQHTVEVALSKGQSSLPLLAEWTNQSEEALRYRLQQAHGDQSLRSALRDIWPKLEASTSTLEGVFPAPVSGEEFVSPSDFTLWGSVPAEVVEPLDAMKEDEEDEEDEILISAPEWASQGKLRAEAQVEAAPALPMNLFSIEEEADLLEDLLPDIVWDKNKDFALRTALGLASQEALEAPGPVATQASDMSLSEGAEVQESSNNEAKKRARPLEDSQVSLASEAEKKQRSEPEAPSKEAKATKGSEVESSSSSPQDKSNNPREVLELELNLEESYRTYSDFQLAPEYAKQVDEAEEPRKVEKPGQEGLHHFLLLSSEEQQDEAYWYLDDMMHELYLWLRSKRSIRTYPRQAKREILLRYPALKDDRFLLLVHFDGTDPIGAAALEAALSEHQTYHGHPISAVAFFAHTFSKRAWPRLQRQQEWHRNVGLFEVTPDGYRVQQHEAPPRPFGMFSQYLEQRQQHRTLRERLPDLSGTSFVRSLHDAPTNKNTVPVESVVVKRSGFAPAPQEEPIPPSPSEPYDLLTAGQMLSDRYNLLTFLEENELGKAFFAEDLEDGSQCILKVIRSDLASSAEFAGRFAQQFEEFRQASRHKSIVTYYSNDIDSKTGLMFFTMEWVEGETLESVLAQSQEVPPISLHRSMRILQRVARALTHIHNRGFVHRDIKPDNIRMTPDGDCKVMDFGIVTNISSTHPKLYTSIWDNAEEAIPRAHDLHTPSGDIYALGVLAYRLLTGRYPQPNALTPPSVYYPWIPPSLDKSVLKALEFQSEDRPSTAVLFVKELQEAAQPLLAEIEPDEDLPPLSEPPSYTGNRSSIRQGSKSGLKELFLNLYSRIFGYSVTKQAIARRRLRLRQLIILLFLLSAGTLAWLYL